MNLGIYWGMMSSASIFVKNKIVAAASEERFTRIKNDEVFPDNAIRYCLNFAGLSPAEIDLAVIASHEQSPHEIVLRKFSSWEVKDYIREQKEYWYPKFYEGNDHITYWSVFADKIDKKIWPTDYWNSFWENPFNHNYALDRIGFFSKYLGLPPEKIVSVDHHHAHALYSYCASEIDKSAPVLAVTIDGWGGGCNATARIINPDGSEKEIVRLSNCDIGRVYRCVTLILGMLPNQHEYKVMGLATYASGNVARKPYEVFANTLAVDGIGFKWVEKPKDLYFWFKERLEGCRFDGIASGLQQWTEELIEQCVLNLVAHTGINRVVVSGGVAMNVKAMGRLAKHPKIANFFVGGSASDESLSIGAAFVAATERSRSENKGLKASQVSSLPNLYLGPDVNEGDEAEAGNAALKKGFKVLAGADPDYVAKELAERKIYARCAGRMEFGQRALGNRSIFADPVKKNVVPVINHAIKNRDFWMPFAPIVLDSFVQEYLVNPNFVNSPHMTIGFDSTPIGWEALQGACHPGDRPVELRPLDVTRTSGLTI